MHQQLGNKCGEFPGFSAAEWALCTFGGACRIRAGVVLGGETGDTLAAEALLSTIPPRAHFL